MVTLIRPGSAPSVFAAAVCAASSARQAEASERASNRTSPIVAAQAASPQAIRPLPAITGRSYVADEATVDSSLNPGRAWLIARPARLTPRAPAARLGPATDVQPGEQMRIRERLRSGSGSGVRAAAACALAAVIALPAAAEARPGDIDPSFRDHGKFTGGPLPSAVAVRPDGKTLVLGTNTLLRLKADGRPDKRFGTGKDDAQTPAGIPIGYSGPGADDLALQPDGKILVAGYEDAEDGSASLVVVRHSADGGFDQGFGTGGRAKVALADSGLDDSGSGVSIALAADGRITVGGELGQTVQLARLTADGLPDATLEQGTASSRSSSGPPISCARSPSAPTARPFWRDAPDPCGRREARLRDRQGERRRRPRPGLLRRWGADRRFRRGRRRHRRRRAARRQGGRGGHRRDRLPRRPLPLADGARPPRHGRRARPRVRRRRQGDAARPGRDRRYAAALELQPDGKLVLAGGGNDSLLARLNPDGTPDAGFGTDGVTWTPFLGVYPAYAEAIALTPDGGMVVAGYVLLEEFYDELAIARYEGGSGPADADGARAATPRRRVHGTSARQGRAAADRRRRLGARVRPRKRIVGGRSDRPEVRRGPRGLLPRHRADLRRQRRRQGDPVREAQGTDRRVDTDRKPGELKLRAPGSGTFYARIATATPTPFEPDGPVELCAADRSAAIRVKR